MQVVNSPLQLYQEANDAGIDIIWMPLRIDQSLATQFDDGSFAIGIDPWKMDTIAKEIVCLGHELGHCNTGSFYNRWATCDIRKKHENRADKWAIERLVPLEDFDQAIADGYDNIPDLADYFNVTEDFMRKAVCFYIHGNLAADFIFEDMLYDKRRIFCITAPSSQKSKM